MQCYMISQRQIISGKLSCLMRGTLFELIFYPAGIAALKAPPNKVKKLGKGFEFKLNLRYKTSQIQEGRRLDKI